MLHLLCFQGLSCDGVFIRFNPKRQVGDLRRAFEKKPLGQATLGISLAWDDSFFDILKQQQGVASKCLSVMMDEFGPAVWEQIGVSRTQMLQGSQINL